MTYSWKWERKNWIGYDQIHQNGSTIHSYFVYLHLLCVCVWVWVDRLRILITRLLIIIIIIISHLFYPLATIPFATEQCDRKDRTRRRTGTFDHVHHVPILYDDLHDQYRLWKCGARNRQWKSIYHLYDGDWR